MAASVTSASILTTVIVNGAPVVSTIPNPALNPQAFVLTTVTENGTSVVRTIPNPALATTNVPAFILTTVTVNGAPVTNTIPNPALNPQALVLTTVTENGTSVVRTIPNPAIVSAASSSSSTANQGVSETQTTSTTNSTIASSTSSRGKSTTLSFQTSFNATSTGVQPVNYVTAIPLPTEKIGVAAGVTAGVAIATLIIGALIATAIMLVVQKKKKRKSRSSKVAPLSAYASNAGNNHGSQGPPAVPVKEKAVVTAETTDPDYLLPQPKDDQSMATAAKQFFIHVDNHVENFYHNEPLRSRNAATSDEDNLLISRKTRFFALKQLICREMLDAISWDCTPENSLFSPTAVATAKSMSRGNLSEATYEVAWSRWRVSTALLLKSEDASLRTQAREYWLDRLQRRLEPFQLNTPGTHAQTREDLYAICKLAENLASTVYSQPARWEFNWPKRSQLVIFPDFVRTTDNSARRLDRPRRVVDAQVMQ